MAEFPALPLWTDAYLGDTGHLTTIEHGAYLLLLMTAWRTKECRLPDDDKLLARYARMTAGQWSRIRPIIEPFFRVEDGFWMQGRLTDEREAVRQKSERGKVGADAKWLKHNKARHANESTEQCLDDGNHNHNHIDSEASASDARASEKPERQEVDFPAPESPIDLRKALFDSGVPYLVRHGSKEGQARSMLGKWRSEFGDAEVIDVLAIAQTQACSDPIPFIQKALRNRHDRSRTAQSPRNGRSAAGPEGLASHWGRNLERVRSGELFVGD